MPSSITPNPLALDDMRLFCRIARLGSLSAVARERVVPVSQISRMLQRMEAVYSVRLMHRSTHGLSLTPEGKRLQESAERMVLEMDELDAELHGKAQSAAGLVRVAMSAMVAQHLIVPSLDALLAQHPALRIDLRVSDHVVDMAREGIDIAIRTGEPTNDLWVVRRLGLINRRVYASPAYLEKHGTPETVPALQQHRLITHSGHAAMNRWNFNPGEHPYSMIANGQLQSDNSALQASMALAGLGLVLLVSWVGQPLVAQGRLIEVLPSWSAQGHTPVSAVMLAERHRLPKVRACVEHWAAWFAQLADNASP
jgi:DNA-binding transcriptional LysR family regulator